MREIIEIRAANIIRNMQHFLHKTLVFPIQLLDPQDMKLLTVLLLAGTCAAKMLLVGTEDTNNNNKLVAEPGDNYKAGEDYAKIGKRLFSWSLKLDNKIIVNHPPPQIV